jgi:hypothetical protein
MIANFFVMIVLMSLLCREYSIVFIKTMSFFSRKLASSLRLAVSATQAKRRPVKCHYASEFAVFKAFTRNVLWRHLFG